MRAALRKKWDSGALLRGYARGEPWPPWSRPLRGPAARELGELLAEVRAWAAQWERADPALRVEYARVGGRHYGTNTIPARAWVDGYEQAWELLGVRNQVLRFTALAELTAGTCPDLLPWVSRRPLKTLELEADWERITDVVMTIEGCQPGQYLRQLDVPGVDTKFIEKHRGVLGELLELRLPPERINRAAPDFERRFGFARKPAYVRFRAPMAGFSELSVRVGELTAPPPGVTSAFIVENEITYLAFPRPAGAMVIWGRGLAVPELAPLCWLSDLDVGYWGDIDTHGYAILDRLRSLFPHVRSLLMDEATLLAHRGQWVREPVPFTGELPHLDAAEAAMYGDLVSDRFGPAVRFEQERVGYAAIERALAP